MKVWKDETVQALKQGYQEQIDALKAQLDGERHLYGKAVKRENALRAREQALVAALQPFTHPDLQRAVGGNWNSDASIVFVRGDAELTLGDFRRAARAVLAGDAPAQPSAQRTANTGSENCDCVEFMRSGKHDARCISRR